MTAKEMPALEPDPSAKTGVKTVVCLEIDFEEITSSTKLGRTRADDGRVVTVLVTSIVEFCIGGTLGPFVPSGESEIVKELP